MPREREVDRETLKGYRGCARTILTCRFLRLLGLSTSGALVENRVFMVELRHSFDVLVCMEQIIITWMPKTLMPEKSFSLSLNGLDGRILLNVFMEWHLVVFLWKNRHFIT